MRSKWYVLIAALLIGVLVLGACGRGGATETPAAEEPAAEAPAAEEAAPAEEPAAEEPAAEEPAAEEPAAEEPAASEAVTGTEETTATEATTETAAAGTDAAASTDAVATLVIWADQLSGNAIKTIAPDFLEQTGVAIELVEKPFGQIRDDFKVAGPAGQGPDLFVGAHDWLGELVASGLLAEVSLGDAADQFEPAAVAGFSFGGKLYGMPYAVENIAFVYNTDLVPEVPATWDEVRELSQELIDGGMKYGWVVEENDPYHFYPVQTAFGGYVFGTNEDGSWNPEDIGIGGEGTIAAFTWLDNMYKDGLLTKGAALNGDLVLAAFTNGDAAMANMGPWRLEALRESGVPFAVAPFPEGPAGPGRPFLGVQGFMLSAFSKQPLVAQSFLQQFVATEAVMMELHEAGGRPSAMSTVNEMIEDPEVKAFAAAGVVGQPMPNIPEMSAVWSAWGSAMQLIGQQTATPEKAFSDAQAQIEAAIAGN